MFGRLILIVGLLVTNSVKTWAIKDSLLIEKPVLSANILQPERDKVTVGCEMNVDGTADIHSGYYVWILVHRTEGFEDVWWPQSQAKIDSHSKRWSAHVLLGIKEDVFYEFEIAAIVVNQQEHLKLKEYRRQALKSGEWMPIDMPPTEEAPIIRKVIKVNHDGCK